MKWFRLWTDILDDPKVARLSDRDFRSFIMLMAYASELDNDGTLGKDLISIAWRLRISIDDLELSIKNLIECEIINKKPEYNFINWQKWQYTVNQLQQNRHRDKRSKAGLPRNRWINPKIRKEVYLRDAYECVACGSQANLTIDHIVPEMEGGTNDIENLQTLCRACNAKKRDLPDELFKQRIKNQQGTHKEPISIDTDTETDSDTDNNTPIVPSKSDLFDQFWKQYPRKDKKAYAIKVWEKIKNLPDIFPDIMAGLAKAKESNSWKKDGGQYIPMPTSWLNARRWEDEGVQPGYESEPEAKPKSKHDNNMDVAKQMLEKVKGGDNNGEPGNGDQVPCDALCRTAGQDDEYGIL